MTPPADTLTDVVLDEIRALAAEPGAPAVRVLQIGAGPDGLTEALLDRLAGVAAPVEEYRCTDADEVALRRLRTAAGHPGFVRLTPLDVRTPLDGQGIVPGSYDLLVVPAGFAAEGGDRQAVRTVKAALARGALLVLHDGGERTESGREVLSTEGFTDIEVFGGAGSRVIAARSDGMVRRDTGGAEAAAASRAAAPAAPATPAVPAVPAVPVVPTAPAAPESVADQGRAVRQTVIETLADALGLAAGQVEPDVSFADFGLNSVSGVTFLHNLNAVLGTQLDSTVIFDHSSAERLAGHILAEGLVPAAVPQPLAVAATPPPAAVTPTPPPPSTVLAPVGSPCRPPAGPRPARKTAWR